LNNHCIITSCWVNIEEPEPILSLQSNHFNPLGQFPLESFHVYHISYTCHISLSLSLSLLLSVISQLFNSKLMISLITHRGQQAPSFNQSCVSLKTFFFHNRSKPQPNLSLPIAFFLAFFLYSKTAKPLTYNCTVPDTEREGGLETRSSTN
jgi:hypothetical protein